MSRTGWKARERQAAALLGGRRYPANQGGLVDVESESLCVQVKARRRLSLAELEALVLEIDRVAGQRFKVGVVAVKRAAGRGVESPWLFVVTARGWEELNGRLPLPALEVETTPEPPENTDGLRTVCERLDDTLEAR